MITLTRILAISNLAVHFISSKQNLVSCELTESTTKCQFIQVNIQDDEQTVDYVSSKQCSTFFLGGMVLRGSKTGLPKSPYETLHGLPRVNEIIANLTKLSYAAWDMKCCLRDPKKAIVAHF